MRRSNSRTTSWPRLRGVLLAGVIALHPHTLASGSQPAETGTFLTTVLDRSGKPLVDLDLDDFVVQEGAQTREVLSAHIADYPVVLLVDRGRTNEEGRALREATRRFVTRLGEQRAVAVMTLDAPPVALVSFDDHRGAALAALDAPWSPAAAAEPLAAVVAAAALLRTTEAAFGAIVVVSSTGGLDSGVAAESPSTISALYELTPTVHVVARRGTSDQPGDATTAMLRALAERTGGRFTTIYAAGSYTAALDGIADRLASEMMVQYLGGGITASSLRVGVKVPGARVTGIRVY